MLKTRQLIPALTARTSAGQIVRAGDYRQKKNLVLVFLHADCPRCDDFLGKLASRAAQLSEREAVALVVFPQPPARAADMSGRSQRAYLGSEAFGPAGQQRRGVFIADRYGELYAQCVAREEEDLPGTGEVLEWLAQIERAGEECGVSHWPAE